LPPKRDTDDFGYLDQGAFGSAHPETFVMAFCDGSVTPLRYDIDPEVHRQGGDRNEAIWDLTHRK
jgi:prepilin-type processing-associated H-X9-DG protein